jgi:hypothetical protein
MDSAARTRDSPAASRVDALTLVRSAAIIANGFSMAVAIG